LSTAIPFNFCCS